MRCSKLRSGADGEDAKPNSKHEGAGGTSQRGSTGVVWEWRSTIRGGWEKKVPPGWRMCGGGDDGCHAEAFVTVKTEGERLRSVKVCLCCVSQSSVAVPLIGD
jgi:hypothetical protein